MHVFNYLIKSLNNFSSFSLVHLISLLYFSLKIILIFSIQLWIYETVIQKLFISWRTWFENRQTGLTLVANKVKLPNIKWFSCKTSVELRKRNLNCCYCNKYTLSYVICYGPKMCCETKNVLRDQKCFARPKMCCETKNVLGDQLTTAFSVH